MEQKFNELSNQIEEEKNRNNKLIQENAKLNIIINDEKKNKRNDSNEKTKLHETIKDLQEKNKNLDEKLKRFPFILGKAERLMSIVFISKDEKVCMPIICKNTDKIKDLEKYFYDKFPEYSNLENEFLSNGKYVDKYQTLENNNIKNSQIIIITQKFK